MLTSDQIDALRDLSGQIVDPIIDFLIEDIARRISEAGQLTSTAAYQVWRAQNLGLSQKQLKKELRKRLKVSHRELRKLLTQAAETGYDFDIKRFPQVQSVPFRKNTTLQQILDATVKLAEDDLTNATQTIGFITYDGKVEELTAAYQKSCDFAFMKVAAGAQDYTSAIRDATRGLAEKGIRTIDYESGVHTSLEAAVRRNIMGGLGLMQEQISQQNHDDLGCDGWEISAHGASAPDHEPIQGKQYSDAAYTRLNNSLLRRIGTLNCGHSAMPIIMGVNSPQYTKEELEEFRRQNEEGITYEGKHYTLYEATQRQRALERSIRSRKRRILIDESAGDKEKLQWDQIRLVRTREEYHRFSKAAGLREQHERMEVAGFTWKHGKTAEKVAKNNQNVKKAIANARKSAIMNVSTGGNRNEIPLTDTQIKECVDYAVSLGVDRNRIRYGDHYNTAYGSVFDVVYIGTDVYPSPNGKTANQKLSCKAALAHEIIGHREACIKGTSLGIIDDVLDEVQASIRAARFAEGLSNSERMMLIRDAVERLRKDGRSIRSVKHLLDIESR